MENRPSQLALDVADCGVTEDEAREVLTAFHEMVEDPDWQYEDEEVARWADVYDAEDARIERELAA
jgi:hypothetical protein